MKSESGFSLAIASQPFEMVGGKGGKGLRGTLVESRPGKLPALEQSTSWFYSPTILAVIISMPISDWPLLPFSTAQAIVCCFAVLFFNLGVSGYLR